jgi:hypothetical protein
VETDASPASTLPDFTTSWTLHIRDPFIKVSDQGNIAFCRAPRNASERQLQLRILANHCKDPETLVPPEMVALDQWVCWKYFKDPKTGNWTKLPYSPKTGRKIGATPKYYDHHVSYAAAIAAYKKFKMAGAGFVLVKSNGFVGVDFDHAVTSNVVHPAVQNWLEQFPSYQEFSPSGRGIHIITKSAIPRAVKTPTIEPYCEDRYFTFTGMHISTEKSINDCQSGIDKLLVHLQTAAAVSTAPRDAHGMTATTARNIYASMLARFREMKDPQDSQNDQLNSCSYFAAKCFAAGVFK